MAIKLLSELTHSDLEEHPIWKHDAGSDDLATITPADDFEYPNTCGYIAKTQFDTPSGRRFIGYCSPQDPSGLDYIQPVIIAGQCHIRLWDESVGSETSQVQVAKSLGLEVLQVFPLSYRCLVAFEGGHWENRIDIAT